MSALPNDRIKRKHLLIIGDSVIINAVPCSSIRQHQARNIFNQFVGMACFCAFFICRKIRFVSSFSLLSSSTKRWKKKTNFQGAVRVADPLILPRTHKNCQKEKGRKPSFNRDACANNTERKIWKVSSKIKLRWKSKATPQPLTSFFEYLTVFGRAVIVFFFLWIRMSPDYKCKSGNVSLRCRETLSSLEVKGHSKNTRKSSFIIRE